MNPTPSPGDYVLATKYHDGDPQDAWAIGYYNGQFDHFGTVRHLVVDASKQNFRANGFRRVKKISEERGRWMLSQRKEIEFSGFSVWHFARCSMKPFKKRYLKKKKSNRGGARPGAGRPRGSPTTTMRVPIALATRIREMVINHNPPITITDENGVQVQRVAINPHDS